MKILVGALFLGLWQSILFWNQGIGISALLFAIPVMYITINLLKGKIQNKGALLISIPIILLSSTYLLFNNAELYLFNLVIIPVLYIIMIIFATSNFQAKSMIYKIILMIIQPINYISDVVKSIVNEISPKGRENQEEQNEGKEKNNVIKAVFFTMIITFIVLVLLASADSEFAKIFRNIDLLNVSDTIARIITIIIAFFYFAGFFMNMLDKENGLKDFEEENKEEKESYTIRMMLTVLNIIYLIFSYTQIKVLFTEQNIKYSEFARNGFFQLLAVSLINIIMILKANNKNLKESKKQVRYKKIMCIVMVIFTLIIIISAFARMTLYQQNYGYTRLRILVDFTLITEIILLIPTLIYIIKGKINLSKSYFVIIVTMYCIVNFANIDGIIAKNNISKYKETGYIDLSYLINIDNTDIIEQLLEIQDSQFEYSYKYYSKFEYLSNDAIKKDKESKQSQLDKYLKSLQENLNKSNTIAEFNLSKFKTKRILNKRSN